MNRTMSGALCRVVSVQVIPSDALAEPASRKALQEDLAMGMRLQS